MAIIGIGGKKQHGKDTVAMIIQWLIFLNSRDYTTWDIDMWIEGTESDRAIFSGWRIKRFADKLKDIVCLLIGCNRAQLEDNKFKEKELGEEWWYYKVLDNNYTTSTLCPYIGAGNTTIKQGKLVKLTPRLLFQLIGTECGRQIIHPNIWVNALMSEYKDKYQEEDGFIHEQYGEQKIDIVPNPILWKEYYPNWIVPDVRFPNEAKAVKDRGGIIIRVNKPFKQWDRTCLDCHKGFDFSEMKEPHKGGCPYCDSYNHAAVLYEQDTHISETALDNYTEFDSIIENNSTIDKLVHKVKYVLQTHKIIP